MHSTATRSTAERLSQHTQLCKGSKSKSTGAHTTPRQRAPAMRSNEGEASRFIRFCCAVGRRGVTNAPVDSRHLLLLPGTRATGGGDRNAAAVLPAAAPSALHAVRLLALLGRAGGSGSGPG